MKWCDLLRVKAEFPINLWPRAVHAYHRWIRTAVRGNMPYDRFVRELLTASGSNFHVPQVNFYRALQSREPQAIARTVALTFMGARADKWPPERLAGMAVFFAQIGYKATGRVEGRDRLQRSPEAGKASAARQRRPGRRNWPAVFPDGTPAVLSPDQDPREVFADWLITPENPWFARHIVNRIWYWLLGRGIVHEPDDIRPDNPARNPELLDYLGRELVVGPLRSEAHLSPDPELARYQLSSIRRAAGIGGRGGVCLLSAAPAGGRGADRRLVPDHRHHGRLFQPHPRTVHHHPGGTAVDRPGRRQHHQPVSGDVRPAAARYGLGIGAQQPSHGRPAAAPAEFQPRSVEDREKRQAAGAGPSRPRSARDA